MYIIRPHHQNKSLPIAKKSFESVAKFSIWTDSNKSILEWILRK